MNIRQIAKRAEVSVATVSRVLNHPESVAAKTREKIEKIIAEEEYTPNWFARGLNFNKTGTIGLMIPHILDSVHMETAKGVEDVAHQKGYITFMCNAEEDEEKERRYLEQLIKRRVDGIILISSTLGEEAILNAMEQNVPIVFVGASKFNPGLSTVRVDCNQGAKTAVSHLVRNGRKKIAILVGNNPGSENRDKVEGYREVLAESHFPQREDYIMEVENSVEGGYLGAKKLMELAEPPDGIFATGDQIALGAMDAIKGMEISIP
ncbi:MAG: LacI family DNA-binding transcriptional regulator, partial [Anaerovoracaceae bacterium]